MKDGKIQWHPAFDAALRIELSEDAEYLSFEPEHLLGKKPLQIDELIVRKNKEGKIHKKLGHLFRKYNIIEYKSPDDYLSISDFYKTYAYACLYQSDRKSSGRISPADITITFVCNRYPRKLLQHIVKYKKMSVNQYDRGIYHLDGNMFPMQLVIIHELSPQEYFWMHSLRNDIKSGGEAEDVIEHYEPVKDLELYQAVMEVILRGNWEEMKEARKTMCQALYELFEEDLKNEVERVRKKMEKEMKEEMIQRVTNEVRREVTKELRQEAEEEMKKLNCLNKILAEKNRITDIIKSANDRIYQKQLLIEFGL